MSGSLAIRFKKRTMAALLSSMASSMFTSMTWAPFSTCWRATDRASSYCSLRIMRAKALEPVTLVRSPTLTNKGYRRHEHRLQAQHFGAHLCNRLAGQNKEHSTGEREGPERPKPDGWRTRCNAPWQGLILMAWYTAVSEAVMFM